MVLADPGLLLTPPPSSSPPKTPHRSYSAQIRSQYEEKNPPPKTALQEVSWWIGSGPKTTLAGDANADIMPTIFECVRERVMRGARTFVVKVKAHRGEPLNERADSHAENARQQLPPECRQWTTRTSGMTYEWSDNGVNRVTVWSKADR
jgi:hypothetical protein